MGVIQEWTTGTGGSIAPAKTQLWASTSVGRQFLTSKFGERYSIVQAARDLGVDATIRGRISFETELQRMHRDLGRLHRLASLGFSADTNARVIAMLIHPSSLFGAGVQVMSTTVLHLLEGSIKKCLSVQRAQPDMLMVWPTKD